MQAVATWWLPPVLLICYTKFTFLSGYLFYLLASCSASMCPYPLTNVLFQAWLILCYLGAVIMWFCSDKGSEFYGTCYNNSGVLFYQLGISSLQTRSGDSLYERCAVEVLGVRFYQFAFGFLFYHIFILGFPFGLNLFISIILTGRCFCLIPNSCREMCIAAPPSRFPIVWFCYTKFFLASIYTRHPCWTRSSLF